MRREGGRRKGDTEEARRMRMVGGGEEKEEGRVVRKLVGRKEAGKGITREKISVFVFMR